MASLFFVRFIILCKDTVNDFLDKNGPSLAAAISFYALFSIFPLILALISISGFVLGSQDRGTQLAVDLSRAVPVSADFLSETLQGVVSTRHITGVAGILGLFWAATAVFSAIRKGVNAVWGVRTPRPFLHERLIDFLLALGAGLLFVASVSVSWVLGFFKEIADLTAASGSVSDSLISNPLAQTLSALVTLAAFLVLYRFLPNTRVRFRDVLWPALLAAAAFEVTKTGFVWYIKTFPAYNAVYGTVSAVVVLLTWVYISATIFLFGALVTSHYSAYRASRKAEGKGVHDLLLELTRVRLKVARFQERR